MQEKIVWKFQAWKYFGFLIPKDRDSYGWDFYVNKNNFWWAEDWDKVEGIEIKSSWKKPEVKIVRVFWKTNNIPNHNEKGKTTTEEIVEWIYSSWHWNFGFVDVEWQRKWYFVYWNKKWKAFDWDKVEAKIVNFKWKKEAVITKVFESEFSISTWVFNDKDSFGFVVTKDYWDIFIPWMKKNDAKEGDKVEVKITKLWKKNKEWIVLRILE
jgi:exoribonuclease R